MTMTMDRVTVAKALEQIACYLELRGENPFRCRAFRTAAKVIQGLNSDLPTALDDGTLAESRGVGPATLEVVRELVASGRSSLLDELQLAVPSGLVEMLEISGLGVAKVRQIHTTLGIDSIPDLEEAASDGRLAALPGFGQKTADNILKGIAFLRQSSDLRLAHHAAQEAAALRAALESIPGVVDVVIAGEVRRAMEVVSHLVLMVVSDHPPAEIFRSLQQLPGISEFAGRDERRMTVRLAGGLAAQVVVATSANRGAVLVQATGSDLHLELLEARARERGCRLAGGALWQGNNFVSTPDEEALYRALGLAYIPPELREGGDELSRCETGTPRLIEFADLQGLLHCHTHYSDGTPSVKELAEACRAIGYRYVGITDHSKAAAYAGGLSVTDIQRQWEEIDRVNAEYSDFRVLKGIESDILADGSLDYSDEVLAGFDFVIASVHSRFTLTKAEMTARIMKAMDNPWMTILGHPTGRLLLSREAYPLDLIEVMRHAALRGVAIEINADPERLDLDWRVLRQARDLGVTISIGSDAHTITGLRNVELGVGIARKGGLGPEEILNTRAAEQFLAFGRSRREPRLVV